jgi:hypothetical protein
MEELEKIYYINVGKGGTFARSGQYFTTPEDVDALFEYLKSQDIRRMLVYFHGGLVKEQNGMDAARIIKENFADKPENHAVSFVWETGFWETIRENIEEIIADSDFEDIINFVIKVVGKKIGLDSRGGGETLDNATIAFEKQQEEPFETMDRELEGKGGGTPFDENDEQLFEDKLIADSRSLIMAETEFEDSSLADDRGEAKGGLLTLAIIVGKIAFRVLKRYHKKTQHDFYPTIIEETMRQVYLDRLGRWAWIEMKEKAENMFESNDGISHDKLHAGTYFLAKLQEHAMQMQQEGKAFSIELMGHSAGSIAICHLLVATYKHFAILKYKIVFFLAPACRTDLFLAKGAPALNNNIFKKFTMFTMDESYEKKDYCVKYVYTHSLLYLVSGLFEEDETDAKIMGLHEQFQAKGRYENFPELQKLNAFLKNHSLGLSIDTTNANNLWTDAIRHGDFDNNEHTLNQS